MESYNIKLLNLLTDLAFLLHKTQKETGYPKKNSPINISDENNELYALNSQNPNLESEALSISDEIFSISPSTKSITFVIFQDNQTNEKSVNISISNQKNYEDEDNEIKLSLSFNSNGLHGFALMFHLGNPIFKKRSNHEIISSYQQYQKIFKQQIPFDLLEKAINVFDFFQQQANKNTFQKFYFDLIHNAIEKPEQEDLYTSTNKFFIIIGEDKTTYRYTEFQELIGQ